MEHLCRKGIPPENVISPELARQLSFLSRDINRQIGLLINRKGEIDKVLIGDHKSVLIPSLEGFRSSSSRFKGLRLIHTHLNTESLSGEDLTDLSHLRLDMIGALEVRPDGSAGALHWAHLIPENPAGNYWLIMNPEEPRQLRVNFLSFIAALEEEFSKKQKYRKMEAAEKAILLRVEKNPLSDAGASLAELSQLARTCGVEVFDCLVHEHYNLISAFHKSLRGSDPDAALYWLGRMLVAGEDPLYIARRMIRFASEDIGNADPQALIISVAAEQAFHFIGLPEGELALAQAAVYLACAPKSNALYSGFGSVKETINKTGYLPVPLHIRNAPTRLMKELDYGKDYKYAHDYAEAYVAQEYLPEKLYGRVFYKPKGTGYEKTIKERIDAWQQTKKKAKDEQ